MHNDEEYGGQEPFQEGQEYTDEMDAQENYTVQEEAFDAQEEFYSTQETSWGQNSWEDPQAEETRWEETSSDLPPEKPRPEIISTNMTINLICTLCAMSGLMGLFLYFADKRSQAVRKYAVQSTALLLIYGIAIVLCFLLGTLLGIVPIIGGAFKAIVQIIGWVLTGLNVAARVRMMLHAYAGEAYVLPLIGEHARTFE